MASNVNWEFFNLFHLFDAATTRHRRKVRNYAAKRHHERMRGNVADQHPSRRQVFDTARDEQGSGRVLYKNDPRAYIASNPSRSSSPPQSSNYGYCNLNFSYPEDLHSPMRLVHVKTHNHYHHRVDLDSIYPRSWHAIVHVLLVSLHRS
jgi:hypothetical protein